LFTLLGVLPLPVAAAADPGPGAPCGACVVLRLAEGEVEPLVATEGPPLAGLDVVMPATVADAARAALLARGVRVWLETGVAGETVARELTGEIAGVVLTAGPDADADADRVAFEVKRTASAIRGEQPSVRIALAANAALLGELAARGVAAYVDVIVLTSLEGDERVDLARAYRGLDRWRLAPEGTGDPLDRILQLTAGSSDSVVLPAAGDPVRAAGTIAALRALLPAGLTPLPDVAVVCDACQTDVWLHPETLEAVAVVRAPYPIETFTARPGGTAIVVADVERGGTRPVEAVRVGNGAAALVPVEAAAATLVVKVTGWRGSDETVYRSDVQVAAPRQLTAEEIVALHQAQRARQAAVVRSVISKGSTVLTFDVPAFAGPVTITAATTVFARGALTEIAQQGIQVNGVELSGDGRVPSLPLIEPERVSAPPLAITLTAAYRYRLSGRERCGTGECHVIEFEPARAGGTSFAGRAWIDARTFGLARLSAAQTGLSGPIVSNEQRDEFVARDVDGRTIWLASRSEMFQVYQAAGLRTPIHRRVDTPEHIVNAPDFEARRAQAHDSRSVMLRDTPEGFRYLVPRDAGSPRGETRVVSPSAGRRVITLAFGVLVDPNISVPLPYAGLSYLDFDFLGSGAQFSGFFGGSYGQAAWTVPRFLKPGWQLTGQAFGIGASYNDRSFRNGRERYDENIRQRPFRADTTVVVPLAPRAQLRVGYEFEYTALDRGSDTAADFVVPNDAVVHGARLGLDLQHGPWTGLLWWNPARRVGWERWGRARDPFSSESADFQRFGLTLARTWVLSPGSVARVEGSWMDGRQLDRFSRYSFDGFANRLRGYPSASIRYDRGLVVRSVATWAPAPQFRLDGFVDYAAVRDPGFGPGLRSYPGIGAALEVPLPHRMLVAVEWGYGFEARNTDGSRGTHVVKVSGFKVF
jgi:hypothetical protein